MTDLPTLCRQVKANLQPSVDEQVQTCKLFTDYPAHTGHTRHPLETSRYRPTNILYAYEERENCQQFVD